MKRAIVVLLGMAGLLYPASALAHSHGAVFTLSNASSGNRVIAYQREADGHLDRRPRHGRGPRIAGRAHFQPRRPPPLCGERGQ
jgi:hypothetical protein